MSGIHKVNTSHQHDLLTNKYRPTRVDEFTCNGEQALQLLKWIQEFLSSSKENKRCKQLLNGGGDDSDYSDGSDSELGPPTVYAQPKCVLLTGPPGVGKTSLVYTVADELRLHVVESHSAEKRDFRLFSSLKLANQKGKINPIAKLFQSAAQRDAIHRVKRQKMTAPDFHPPPAATLNTTQSLSLSSDTSILLFDDIDVVFEEDGPFLKSLVEFIKESKRPIVLTATKSIDSLKNTLGCFEHIHLSRPAVESCAKLLRSVCLKESFDRTAKKATCAKLANYYNCDIRRCLNKIHLYENRADELVTSLQDKDFIEPKIEHLNLIDLDAQTDLLLSCYTNLSLIDLMDRTFHINHSESTEPDSSLYADQEGFGEELGKQIRHSLAELTIKLFSNHLMNENETLKHRDKCLASRNKVTEIGHIISEKLITRIEPHEHEFFTDIVPLFGEVVKLEALRKVSLLNGDNLRRRSRRTPSYLDDKGLYFENDEIKCISETIVDWMDSV